jgi:hypothetical protein
MSTSRRRTRPYFTNPDGSTRHWSRFDGVYRSSDLRQMWCVVDDNDRSQYVIVHYDAQRPMEGDVVSRLAYGPSAFATQCQMAERLAKGGATRSGRFETVSNIQEV